MVGFASAFAATMPWNVVIEPRAEVAGRAVENVQSVAADGVTTRGWLVRAAPDSQRCVVLAAGIRGNRLAMLRRAEWYLANGWSALSIDLRGTGESDPARISMGWHEARDLAAWHDLARGRGFTVVGVHGQSLGAAAVVYGAVRSTTPPRWDFAVLEACYRDIDNAMTARLPWIPFPRLLLWPFECCADWLTAANASDLRPVDAIRGLAAPTLFVCGADDRIVGPNATADLFAASPARDKRIIEIAGAGHVDLWPAGGDSLRAAIAAFLASR